MVKFKLKNVITCISLLAVGGFSAALISSCGKLETTESLLWVDGTSFKDEVTSIAFAKEYCTIGKSNLDFSSVDDDDAQMLGYVQSKVTAKNFMYLMAKDFVYMFSPDKDWGDISDISLVVVKKANGCFMISEYWRDATYEWSSGPKPTVSGFFGRENAELKIASISATFSRDSLAMEVRQVRSDGDLLHVIRTAEGEEFDESKSFFTYTIDYSTINYMFPNSSWPAGTA